MGEEGKEVGDNPNLVEKILKEIDFRDCSIWGHGTLTEEIAAKILQEGIRVNPGYTLLEIASPITNSAASPDQNAAAISQSAQSWGHKDAKYLVLISIPDGTRPNFVVEHIVVDGQERTQLPTRFIRGYVDATKEQFVSNPQFVKDSEPTKGLLPIETGPHIRIDNAAETTTPTIPSSRADTPDVW